MFKVGCTPLSSPNTKLLWRLALARMSAGRVIRPFTYSTVVSISAWDILTSIELIERLRGLTASTSQSHLFHG